MKIVRESLEDGFKYMKPKTPEELEALAKQGKFYNYRQLCVWPGTLVGSDKIEEFEEFMLDHFNTRVKYAEEVLTLPGDGGEGGRNDLFFYVHDDDIAKFAIPRLKAGIRWWEDVVANMKRGGISSIYPQEIFKKYPLTW